MPLYIGDYLADTMDLTMAQHGAYLLSIMHYWRKGESMTDRELRAITKREFVRVSEFFIWCDNRWHHKRIDRELAIAREKILKQQEKARKGVEARRTLGLLPPVTGEPQVLPRVNHR